MRLRLIPRLSFLLVLAGFVTVSAGAEVVTNCKTNIPSTATLPFVISTPGTYCLTGDLLVASSLVGRAIQITSNNVVLELNAHRIDGTNLAGSTTVHGIDVTVGLRNVAIRNGTIHGFLYGIQITDNSPYNLSRGHLVENILADGVLGTAISVKGRGNVVQNNQIVATGGTTITNTSTIGIEIYGPDNHILNNDVTTVQASGSGTATAMVIGGSSCTLTNSMAVGNRLSDATFGISYGCGTGKYRDNLTSSIATAYTGGTDAGNNN